MVVPRVEVPNVGPIDGLTTSALGALRGDVAWVLRAVTAGNTTTAEIWAVAVAGGDARLAASYRVGPFSPFGPVTGVVLDRQLSVSGTRLVLELPDYDRPRQGLFIVDLASGSTREITGSLDATRRWITPAWSPDPQERGLAFVAVGDLSGGTLMTIGSDGAEPRAWVQPRIPDRTVLYGFADEGHIAFGRALEGATYEVFTTNTSQFTWRFPGDADGWRPPAPADWRAEMPMFVGAMSEGNKGGEQRIVIADRFTTPLRVIAREPVHKDPRGEIPALFSAARWGPRGDVLYQRSFVPDTSGPFEHDCFTVGASGGTPARVPLRGKAFRCEWLPTGDRIAYLHGDTGVGGYATVLRIAARDGSGEREYTLPPAQGATDVRLLDVAIRVYQ